MPPPAVSTSTILTNDWNGRPLALEDQRGGATRLHREARRSRP
jgi:hypothetical protein